jgi:N-acetylmuramoyl-L-alanine amidase
MMKTCKNKTGRRSMRICIDPGHSGPVEPGACAGGVTEADVNLQVAKTLAKMLEKAGHKVKLTREDDVEDQELSWRAEEAWSFRADIFICIHCNADAGTAAHGTEVYYYTTSDNGHALARCIQAEVVKNCRTEDRGVKTNDRWTVLTDTYCPAVLVELAFLTNDKDRELLTDPFNQRLLAVGIMNGITVFERGGPLFGDVA